MSTTTPQFTCLMDNKIGAGAHHCATQCASCQKLAPAAQDAFHADEEATTTITESATTRTDSVRDPVYEDMFLQNVEQEAQRRYGADAEGLATHVKYRLALGAQRYGDNDFLNKNIAREALDEAFDLVAYPLLQAQKLLADAESDDEQLRLFFDAAVFAAAAYASLRQALATG